MNAELCPCGLRGYESCCKPFHDGANPDTPLALMRSRYSAYALDLPGYIRTTTHPKSPHFESDPVKWAQSVHEFCKATRFMKLEIFSHGSDWVHFCAHLEQNGQLVQLNEKSYFEKLNGFWMYTAGLYDVQPKT